jgi:hypothetical protein
MHLIENRMKIFNLFCGSHRVFLRKSVADLVWCVLWFSNYSLAHRKIFISHGLSTYCTLHHIIWSFLKWIFVVISFYGITLERNESSKKRKYHWEADENNNKKFIFKLKILFLNIFFRIQIKIKHLIHFLFE